MYETYLPNVATWVSCPSRDLDRHGCKLATVVRRLGGRNV